MGDNAQLTMAALTRFSQRLWHSRVGHSVRVAKSAFLRLPFGPAIAVGVDLVKMITATPRPGPAPSHPSAPFFVVGLLSSPTGLGEAARLAAKALEDLAQPTIRIDVTRTLFDNAPLDIDDLALEGQGGTVIIVLNAPHMPRILRALGGARLRGKRIVGFWHWELPQAPMSWYFYARYLHEVWAPTRFVADAVRKIAPSSLRIVPHPVRLPVFTPLDRTTLGVEKTDFVALCLFNLDSGFHRKNPHSAIRAFRAAFADRPGFRLILKTRPVAGHEQEKAMLIREIGPAKNIIWLNRTMEDGEVAALVQAADVVLSLHRSEGFGLVPAQAMLLGVPIIATDWSSTTDFLTHENAALVRYRLVPLEDPHGVYRQRNAVWAEPDTEHAAFWLKTLAGDSALRERLGARARQDAEQMFSAAAFAKALGLNGS